MGDQCQLWLCQLAHQHALPHVVRFFSSDPSTLPLWMLTFCLARHASIDPAVRAARNLPEDLIRLCVGIEDAEDLIDDLEAALLEAGAIQYVEDGQGGRRLERVRSKEVQGTTNLTEKLERIALDSKAAPETLITSAPGKVILFGEHAVVHGVVRYLSPLRFC
jgi:hypothetical protein